MKYKYLGLVVVTISAAFFGCNQPNQKKEIKTEKPNILLIVADDMGYSDIAPFGGNINTPVCAV